MTSQNGLLVLIKVGNGGMPETFATIGGLRTSSLVMGNYIFDATTLESGAWRSLLGNAGILSMSIHGSGIFTNSASEELVRGYVFNGTINNYKFIFANGNNVTGPFQVTSYDRSGNYDAEEIYSLTLESAGTIIFATS